MAASALIVTQAADRTWAALLVTLAAALVAATTRLNPLWILLAGGILGLAGLI
jgi:chromate transporter